MIKVHLPQRSPSLLTVSLVGALFISAVTHSEARTDGSGKLKTLDEIVKTLPRFDVSVKVIDKLGKPIPGAEVWLYYARGHNGLRDRLAGRGKTAEDGIFGFEKAMLWEPQTEQGRRSHEPHYIVIARHADHGIYFTKLFQGDSADSVEIAIKQNTFGKEKNKTKTITITDKEGNPIGGVRVYLCGGRVLKPEQEALDRKYQYVRFMQDLGIISGITNDKGTVALQLAPGVNYWAEKEGYNRTWIPGNKGIMFTGAQVSGTVRYPDGTPAAGAAVSYVYHGNGLVWDEVTVTDAEGRYIFENVPASGFYYSWMDPETEAGAKGSGGLTASDLRLNSPLLSKKQTFIIRPGEKLQKDLTFQASVKLAGKIIDLTSDKPVPGMELRMLIETGQRYLDSKPVVADENGHFETTVAPGSNVRFSWEESRTEGRYLIDEQWKRQGNYQPSFRKTVTEDETDLLLKVKLVPVGPLSGRVVDKDGNGVARAAVHVHADIPYAKADDAGAFELKAAFTERDFDLYAESPDGSLAGLAHLKAGATTATITLAPTRTFTGEVTNTGGLPAENLKFYMDLRLNGDNIYRVRREPTTDQDGKFTAKNLCPQALMYAWWSSDNKDNRDYDYGNAEIDLAKLAPDEPIRFEAKQYLNTLMGKVTDDGGKPIVEAAIRIGSFDIVQQNERSKQYATDAKGEFEIPRLAPGKVELTITAKGYLTKRFSPDTDSFDFEAVLRSDTGERVNIVKVVNDDDEPLTGVPIHLWISKRPEGAKEITHEMLRAITDKEGVARFELGPAAGKDMVGRSTVECDIEGYDLAYAAADPREELDLVLRIHKSDRHWQGQALDAATGKPLPGATAHVYGVRRENSSSFASCPEEKRMVFHADDKGVIRFERFNEKDGIGVDVTAPGYAKEQKWLSSDRPDEAIFRLSPAGKILGKVVRTDGGELPADLRVHLRMTSGRGSSENLPVEKDGSFSWEHCAPGTYKLSAASPSEEGRKLVCPSDCEAEVKTGQTVKVVIEMEEGVMVCGKMLDAATGKPLSDVKSAYVGSAEGRSYSPIKEDGSWQLYLLPGEHKITYRCMDMKQQKEFRQLKVKKGTPIKDLVIKVDAKTGQASRDDAAQSGTRSRALRR